MKKVVSYETQLDEPMFGLHDEETGELIDISPSTPFERAVVESLDYLRECMRAELVDLAKRIDALEAKATND